MIMQIWFFGRELGAVLLALILILKLLRLRMYGAIPPLPNTSSWRDA